MPHSAPNATVQVGSQTAAGPGLGASRPPLLPTRYTLDVLLGVGGMGEVWRVADAVLDRRVAMKITFATTDESRDRFRSEAKILARLEHPSIVPIYDLGTLEDGRLWFTMREVAFRTLWELIAEVHEVSGPSRWGVTSSGWSFHRLMLAMLQVCEAVAHAHAAGIAHLDLKPNNVLVGNFGEVQVADWGIARVSSIEGTARPTGGTAHYMPPEQSLAEPGRDDLLCDVYAVGCMLYTVYSGKAPPADLSKRVTGAASRLPGNLPPVPEELVALMHACMEPVPTRRPQGVAEVAVRLRAWLDGSERRSRADGLVADAERAHVRAELARAAAARVRVIADRVATRVPPYAPVFVKRPGWALDARARAHAREAEAHEADEMERLHTALALDDAHAVARTRLGDRYVARLDEAEARRDAVQVTRVGAQLRALAPERWERWQRDGGVLSLVSDPPGAEATLYRYEEHDRQLVPRLHAELGRTPIVRAGLPAGSWLVELRAPGRAVTRYPVHLRRGETWSQLPPGQSSPEPVRLLPAEGITDDLLHVPAGWFRYGAEDEVPDGMRPGRAWVDDFLIQRHPVTVGDYLGFLNDLVRQGRTEEAWASRPVHSAGTTDPGREPFRRRADLRFELNPDSDNPGWSLDKPIVFVGAREAEAYAAWLSERDGRVWRLPHELEWEKAARGVDGRPFPWGDSLDPAWANTMLSHSGPPRPTSVHAFPLDISPYGMRGAGGNVREWTATHWTRAGASVVEGRLVSPQPTEGAAPYRIIRGGCFVAAPNLCRAEARFAAPPTVRVVVIGFRLVSPS